MTQVALPQGYIVVSDLDCVSSAQSLICFDVLDSLEEFHVFSVHLDLVCDPIDPVDPIDPADKISGLLLMLCIVRI